MATAYTLPLTGPATQADIDQGSLLFIGTATTLIRYGGLTILTDPNFLHAGDHVHLGYATVLGVLLTMDAAQGVQALRLIQPRRAIPIHYNDYTVFKSPLEDFMAAVKAAGLEDKVHYLHHGDTYTFAPRRD